MSPRVGPLEKLGFSGFRLIGIIVALNGFVILRRRIPFSGDSLGESMGLCNDIRSNFDWVLILGEKELISSIGEWAWFIRLK